MEGPKCQELLDARTRDPGWVMRVWTPVPRHNPSFPKGGGVPCLCYGGSATAQGKWMWKSAPFSGSCRHFTCTFLTCYSAFPSLILVQLRIAAANSSRVPLQPHRACCSLKPGQLVLQPAWGWICVPTGQRGQVRASKGHHHLQTCYRLETFLREGRAVCTICLASAKGIDF